MAREPLRKTLWKELKDGVASLVLVLIATGIGGAILAAFGGDWDKDLAAIIGLAVVLFTIIAIVIALRLFRKRDDAASE